MNSIILLSTLIDFMVVFLIFVVDINYSVFSIKV